MPTLSKTMFLLCSSACVSGVAARLRSPRRRRRGDRPRRRSGRRAGLVDRRRGRRGLDRGGPVDPPRAARRRRRRPRRRRWAGRPQQSLGLVEPQLVAAAVLLGGALDVGDPVAVLVRVGDRLARGDALLLDGLGLVEEPLDLQLGLLREAGVRALVPDPDAHLEEADGVRVAEVEVLHPRLDERGHDRQLAAAGRASRPRPPSTRRSARCGALSPG